MANNDSTVFNKNMIIIVMIIMMMMMMTMIIIAMINNDNNNNNNNNDKFSDFRISPLFLAVLQCLDTFLASLVTIGCHGYEI